MSSGVFQWPGDRDDFDADDLAQLREVEAKHPQVMVATRCAICGERIAPSDVALCLDCMDEEVGD